jgi:acetyl esterase
MKTARLSALTGSSHLWPLRRARAAIHKALSGRDRLLPELAELRRIQLPGAAGPLEGRLYRPIGVSADAPLLLFFHGGGFVVSDLDTHESLCIRLADAGRMRVLSAQFRLAGLSRPDPRIRRSDPRFRSRTPGGRRDRALVGQIMTSEQRV